MLVRNLLGFSIYFKLFLTSLEILTETSFSNDLKGRSCLGTIIEEDIFLCSRSDVHELRHVWNNAGSASTQVLSFSLSKTIDLTCAVKLYQFRSMFSCQDDQYSPPVIMEHFTPHQGVWGDKGRMYTVLFLMLGETVVCCGCYNWMHNWGWKPAMRKMNNIPLCLHLFPSLK